MAESPDDKQQQVRFEAGRGWICSCTGVWIERIDFDLDCHHWPLCEHVVAAAKARANDPLTGRFADDLSPRRSDE